MELKTDLLFIHVQDCAVTTERKISSIRHAIPTDHKRQHFSYDEEAAELSPNSEHDRGHDRESGNLIYSSLEIVPGAMKREG